MHGEDIVAASIGKVQVLRFSARDCLEVLVLFLFVRFISVFVLNFSFLFFFLSLLEGD